MKLSKDDFELLCSNRNAFLVKAYLSYDPTPTVRECAEVTGLSKSYCQRLMSGLGTSEGTEKGTSEGTSKATTTKAKMPKQGTSEGTEKGTSEGTPKDAPQPYTLTYQLRLIFDEYYREVTGQEYYWEPKEMVALKRLASKIDKGMRDKGLEVNDEGVCSNFKLLLGIIEDRWLLDNLTPTLINSKYNDIRTQYARRQQSPRSSRGATCEEIIDAIKQSL